MRSPTQCCSFYAFCGALWWDELWTLALGTCPTVVSYSPRVSSGCAISAVRRLRKWWCEVLQVCVYRSAIAYSIEHCAMIIHARVSAYAHVQDVGSHTNMTTKDIHGLRELTVIASGKPRNVKSANRSWLQALCAINWPHSSCVVKFLGQ